MPYLHRDDILRILTPREQDVVTRIALGLEIKEIAQDLHIGYQTTKMHIQHAKAKLHARNQLEIAILMYGGRPQAAPDHKTDVLRGRVFLPARRWLRGCYHRRESLVRAAPRQRTVCAS